ncbi:Putative defect at low temperature protein [Septoria linicola]|uniref:Defect at low temperature protein 1 n=1 Tax=Septoria linicola TaxID=215465 RepID=A0A9Q9AXA6_9PEZI|nr:putative defect at low temperature protein [Septoria linicola]USW52346.1 Putative defect at low temperature protein [Septoria linicola]
MARTKDGGRRILPFRIPIFRVFYSLTYTTLYLLTLFFLAISPVTMIYSSIDQSAYQYTFMIGGVYFLTAIIAVFIYSSRLYTNRRVLSDIGKPYVPIEDGEVGKTVRKMIVKQLDRSAVVAWESRPRDLYGEILLAGQQGILPKDDEKVQVDEYTVGSEIRVDPARPPWGDIQHIGWSSPSHHDDNRNPDVQFADVIAELPNLIEARAVSLAPADPTMTPVQGEPRAADPAVVDTLSRPTNMPLRDYLTHLGYLGLVQPVDLGQKFVLQYEQARFGFLPPSADEFNTLMATFAELLAGMTLLGDEIVREIRAQMSDQISVDDMPMPHLPPSITASSPRAYSPESSLMSPVTAREGLTPRVRTPYLSESTSSQESLGSVVRRSPEDLDTPSRGTQNRESFYTMPAPSSSTLPSDTGSVLIHDVDSAG